MESMRYAHNEGHTDVCYSDDFKFIITCGSEGDVRVWSSVDDVDQRDLCVGERAWAIAQKKGSLYVGTDNNTVQIYTFPQLTNDGIISRFTAPATHIMVSDDGKTVASGSCDMEIHVVDVDSMECTKLIDHKGPVLSISLDPLQKYLVSSGCDGVVKVWLISSRDILKQWDGLKKSNSFENSEFLYRMDFNPTGSLLAVPFGELVKVFERDSWNQVKSFSHSSSSDFNIAKFSPCGKLLAAGTTSGTLFVWGYTSTNVVKQEKNLSKHAITGISWKGDSKSIVFCNAMGQLGNLEVPEASFSHIEEESAASSNLDDVPIPEPVFDDEDDEDDENVISLEKIKSQTGFHRSQTSLASKSPTHDDDRSIAGSLKYTSPVTDLQEPFQPSSTPQHLQQRFMVWNGCGIVRQFNSEGVDDIDIEYHDTTRNHGLRLNNVAGHTMAALTPQAAVLACPKSEDGAPSKLVCLMMKAWDGSKEWDCCMPDSEEVIGVAAGDGWVAAITDSLILRLFSLDGTQVDVTSIPGPFIAATGSGHNLTVVFHSGVGVDSQQCISYSEIVVDPTSKMMSVVSTKPLPMSPKSLLRWVGYTDESSLCSLDSCGMLRLLYQNQWRPICSLDNQFKSKFDHYFVVGVSEMSQNIRCILCKGSFYPPVLPKPLVNEIKWQIPLCELDSEKGKLEEEYLRNRIVIANINDDSLIPNDDKSAVEKTISITIMKLFALACRSGLESRALTLCESMPTVDVVRLASKYAAKIGRQHLASKVNEVASSMTLPSYPVRNEGSSHRKREKTPERSAPDDIYSQDMFEDSEPIVKEKENLIHKMQQLQKKKKESVSPKPMRILKAGNPFKKGQGTESRNNVSLNDSTSESKQTFMEWYEENRQRLQEENPMLKEGELAVAAMKHYRQQMLQSSSNPLDVLSQSSNKNETESNPKKASDETVEAPKKRSIGESSDPEPRKRKADPQEDDKPKKKPNCFSKLNAFAFSKTS